MNGAIFLHCGRIILLSCKELKVVISLFHPHSLMCIQYSLPEATVCAMSHRLNAEADKNATVFH